MKLLFIGGTGILSSASTRLALARGFKVTHLNRGQRVATVEGVEHLTADINDPAAAAAAIGTRRWDVVVDFIAFTPEQMQQRIALFKGRCDQFIFISSASAYARPVAHYLITESTPLNNPYWSYSRDKIACEQLLMDAWRAGDLPVTIIRPSYTYCEWVVPLAFTTHHAPYTVIDRLRRGAPVIIPGDGSSLWTMTHSSDFAKGLVGLLGHRQALGQAFHITSDEVLCWNQIFEQLADAAGVREPKFVHIASDFLAACWPEETGGLHGDKSSSVVLDNSKIKRYVPDYCATVRFADGIRQSVAWYDADPSRRVIDAERSGQWDVVIEAYAKGLAGAQAALSVATR